MKKKRILSIALVVLFAALTMTIATFRQPTLRAYASDETSHICYDDDCSNFQDKKVYSARTLDDDFFGDTITIVLSKEATFSFKEYTSADFADIGTFSVEEVTAGTLKIVQEQIKKENTQLKAEYVKINSGED